MPLASEDSTILESMMCQDIIRTKENNVELGLLTFEKETLFESPFMKKVELSHNIYLVNQLNYPNTGEVPFFDFTYRVEERTVNFESFSNGAKYYFWQFGDGTSSIEQNPVHIYPDNIGYRVHVTITSHDYMTTTFSKFIRF